MKLTKDINTKVYEVLTDYKVKIKTSPFIAILKFALENDSEITKTQLYQDFLQPLSEKACENILDRLINMGYFEKDINNKIDDEWGDEYYNDDEYDNFISNKSNFSAYSLTDLGNKSAEQEEFYDNRKGILKIYVVDNEFIPQKVVKIEEIDRQESFDEKYLRNIQRTELQNLQNSNEPIDLENGTFIIDSFKEKCREFKNEKNQLSLDTNNESSIIKLLKFKGVIQKDSESVKNEILKNEYQQDYLIENQILITEFNPNELELKRNIKIDTPLINDTDFDSLYIDNIKVSPHNIEEAKEWFKALLLQNINKYFMSENEFVEFANTIAQKFELFNKDLENRSSREDIIMELDDTKDFYKRAKLETIDYLNY